MSFRRTTPFCPALHASLSDQAVADLDWNISAKDILAAKYYYQHDPSTSPYAYSNVPGFTAHMDTGSQVGSLNNVQTIGSTLSIAETVGVLREKAYATNDQPFDAATEHVGHGTSSAFGNYFPRHHDQRRPWRPVRLLNWAALRPDSRLRWPSARMPNTRAPTPASFQNRIMPSGTAIWAKGRHSLSFGGS